MASKNKENVADEELVRRAQTEPASAAGRHAAAELLTRYTSRIYGICFYYTGDRERAHDLSQDILLRAYEKLGSFQGRSRFASWIYAIARNRCRNELSRGDPLFDDNVALERLSDRSPDPVEDLVQKLDEEALLSLIQQCLSEEEQIVLWLRCVEKIPHSTLNEFVGSDLASGARGVLQRARRKLRSALDAQRDTQPGTQFDAQPDAKPDTKRPSS